METIRIEGVNITTKRETDREEGDCREMNDSEVCDTIATDAIEIDIYKSIRSLQAIGSDVAGPVPWLNTERAADFHASTQGCRPRLAHHGIDLDGKNCNAAQRSRNVSTKLDEVFL